MDGNAGVFHFKCFEDLAGLAQNGVAVVEADTGLQRDLQAAAIAWLDGNVQVSGCPGPSVRLRPI